MGASNFHIDSNGNALQMAAFPQKPMLATRSLWIGAKDSSGNAYVSANTYGQSGFDFQPGPLNKSGNSIGNWAMDYKKVWKISASEIEAHKLDFYNHGSVSNVNNNIKYWPVYAIDGADTLPLAPWFDYNKNGYYDPENGDYPMIKGDEAMFTVFNDKVNHGESNGNALGIQICELIWSVHCPSWNNDDTFSILENTVFVEYTLTNRSKVNYPEMYIGSWNDPDLGNYADDYVGCAPDKNVAFCYNGDSIDEGSVGYGANPPIMSTVFLQGPLADKDGMDNDNDGVVDNNNEMCLMGSFIIYNNSKDPSTGIPSKDTNYLHLLEGNLTNGSPARFGFIGSQYTKFIFSHGHDLKFPGQIWTESSASNFPGDRRFLASTTAFPLDAGNSVTQALAYHVVETNYMKDPVDRVIMDADIIRKSYESNSWKNCQISYAGFAEVKNDNNLNIYPNPAGNELHIHLPSGGAMINIRLFDISGTCVMDKKIQGDNPLVTFDISNLNSGIYFVQIQSDNDFWNAQIVKE